MYYVSEKGWTQVWAGDTTDMYYGYYPIVKKTLAVENVEMADASHEEHK